MIIGKLLTMADVRLSFESLALTQIWQVTVVILVVAVIVRIAGTQRTHLAHLLWMLVLVKALTPPLITTPWSVYSMLNGPPVVVLEDALTKQAAGHHSRLEELAADATRVTDVGDIEIRASVAGELIQNEAADVVSTKADQGDVSPLRSMKNGLAAVLVVAIWLFGAIVTGLFTVFKLVRFYLSVRWAATDANPRLQTVVERLRQRLGVRRRVTLIVSREHHVPTAFGFLHARIVISEALIRSASAEQLQMTIAHELVHIRRGDLYTSILQVVAQIVWWYHPLVWWVNGQATRAIEECCDQEVLYASCWQPTSYARCLLELGRLHRSAKWAPALPAMRPVEITRRRLESIVRRKRFHRRASWQYWAITVTLTLLVIPSGNSPRAKAPPSRGGSSKQPSLTTAESTASRDGPRKIEIQPVFDPLGNSVSLAGPVLGQTPLAHRNTALPLGFVLDGDLVSASADGTLCYWNLNTGQAPSRVDLPRFTKRRAWWKLPLRQHSKLHNEAVLSRD